MLGSLTTLPKALLRGDRRILLSSGICERSALYRNAHLCRLPSHYHELFRALHQEARESVTQDCLNLIGLLHSDANSHTVDAGFNKTPLLLIPANSHRVEQQLLARPARGGEEMTSSSRIKLCPAVYPTVVRKSAAE